VSIIRMPSELIERELRNKVFGVVPAIVTNNKDPDSHYRVKVRFPFLSNGDESGEESDWCRVATIGAGPDRGFFNLPEVGDEVLVAFEHGDVGRPYIVGSMWNGQNKTHDDNSGQSGKNDRRSIKTRSGHILEFNDKKGEEKIALKSKTGARLVIDDKDGNKKIELYDDAGDNYVLIDVQNKKITIETKTGDMLLKAKNTIRLEAKTIETKSDKDTKMEVGANFSMKATSNMTITAGGTGEVKSDGQLTVKGSTVNIN
jgi:uncharacterized protein involved in type VI secretion and phage assembly